MRKTLGKTKGDLDWNHGLTNSVVALSHASPIDMLEIAKLYLIDGGIRSKSQKRIPLRAEGEWFDALKILFNKPETKSGVFSLIDTLVREGGSAFWNLKAIIKK